ncbi:MAG: D-glycerate 2-kinase [Labilithrix sp.]|nr:D-glycerate 2-kinase [Labilithrix sp.]
MTGVSRAEIERVFARALRELDPGSRVHAALSEAALPVRIIAIGKAAPAMAAGAIAKLHETRSTIDECLVVAPDGTDAEALLRAAARARIADRLVVIRAAHPLPDARSVRAGEACLAAAATDVPTRLVVLVSGGASALACAPSNGVTLATKRAITRAMLESGASVQDINVVRKHLSRLKGGGLWRAAGTNPMVTLVASDVIGGTASDVGSGPSVPDTSTVRAARGLLRRFAPSFAGVRLVGTSARSPRTPVTKVVVSPEELARVVARLFARRGHEVSVLPPSQATADELAAEYVALAARARRRIFVRAAEPSISVSHRKVARGRGGRSTHLAALVGAALERDVAGGRHRVRFAALASDGVDGTSGTAGAIIDDRFATHVAARLGPHALERAIATFDTGTLHARMGTAVGSAATGQNLADLHILIG